jgi:prevent-host-death family protein
MKRISIQDLKASLSSTIAEAESGRTIVITRHNQPVALLAPAAPVQTHVGSRSARPQLKPLLRRASKGRYLEVLREDRQGER